MKFDEAFQLATTTSGSDKHIVYKCAKKFCRDTLHLENQVLEEPQSLENILKNEVEIPKSLKKFYKALYTREDEAKKSNIFKKIQIC